MPARRTASAVISTLASQSWMRLLQALGGEAGENHAVDGADPGAGQQGDGQFGNHGQIDGHPVAFFHAHFLQHVGETADLGVQHLVGVDPDIALRVRPAR